MAQAKTIVIIAPVNPGDEDRDIHSVVSLCEPDSYVRTLVRLTV
jgi:hypothetical protein